MIKTITIFLNDDITPIRLSEYLNILHNHYRDYIHHINIDYNSDMETKEEKDELKIRWKDASGRYISDEKSLDDIN